MAVSFNNNFTIKRVHEKTHRAMVDDFAGAVVDSKGRPVKRDDWDFQDLARFVAAAKLDRRPAEVLGEPTSPGP